MGDRLATEGHRHRNNFSPWQNAVLAAAAGLVAVRAAPAEVIRDDTPDSLYQALSAQPQYAGPTAFVDVQTGTSSTETFFNFGTGTLIAPDWILTAAHVVSQTSNSVTTTYPASAMSFGQGTTLSLPGPGGVASVVTESGWSGDFSAGNDLALLQLATPITNQTPAQLYTGSTTSLLGMTATVIGYGDTGTGLTGYTANSYGTRRGLQNTIDTTGGSTTNGGPPTNETYDFTSFSPNLLFDDFDSPNPTVGAQENVMGSSTPLALEGSTAPGDSGGGLFVTVGGTTFLAGVTSFGGSFTAPLPAGIYGEVNAFTSVSATASMEFIQQTLTTNTNWSATGGGSWATIQNWASENPPEFKRSVANFAAGISRNSTITLDDDWTVGQITFNNTNSYTLAPGHGGLLTLDETPGASAAASITDSGGTHFISAPIELNSKLNVNVANAGDTLTLSGGIDGVGPLKFTGPGTLVLSGSDSYSLSTAVTGGQLNIGSAAAIPNGTPLSVSASSANGKITLLNGIGTVSLSALTINTNSSVDVGNNAIAINFGSPSSDPIATIAGYLQSRTLMSSATIASRFALGYADGNTDTGTAAAQNQILVKYTLAGDATLDGAVGFADLVAVAEHFGSTGQDWADGNFTYAPNGSVGFADLVLVAENFGQSLTASASVSPTWALSMTGEAGVAEIQSTAVVPEPALVGLAFPAFALLARRRKR